MNESQVSEEALEAALAAGSRPPVGRYRLDLTTGHWAWSDEIFEMHGFAPGDIVPTTELMLTHKHPDDRERVDSVLKQAARTGQPFSSVHRIVDGHGKVRTLAVTGQGRRDPDSGEVTELFGYFIDVTDAHRELAQREATVSIQASAERRASIEQAKGVLMVGLGLEPDDAFDRLRVASNLTNVPVRELATWLVEWFARPGMTTFPTTDELTAFLDAPVPAPVEDEPAAETPAAG
ncbi:PAS and ANTAR domain-containing protein [Isoptericola cucumis]|uniref:histidine kinase n=1 Tax=Isoptericola cucumis TaxID=1776856 RepID=A0ABQ2BAE5_9MICO|nr:PAS and ANTAR domain-containing protein [Isoptericola cucumis]GGI11624.1 putative transcription antitermination regulator [Isoptericola cucumis]